MSVWLDVAVVIALILVEGLFVAAELALVSLREGQARALARQSRRGQKVVKLVTNPNRFLAAVQLGVTLTALLSSAFGAVTLSKRASTGLRHAGLGHRPADALGFLGVTILITFVTLVVGELAPKRLALQRTERISLLFAPALDVIARASRPVIWLLSVSTNGLVKLLGGDPLAGKTSISEEELRGLVAAHETLGVEERQILDEVFEASSRLVREVLVPRTEVTFLDAGQQVGHAFEETSDMPHSRYPVVRGSVDDVVGFVHIRDLAVAGRSRLTVGQVTRPVIFIPSSLTVLTALSQLRREGHHLAMVADEYGGIAGIVTLEDLIEELLGEIRDEYDPAVAGTRSVVGGDLDVDALLNLDEFFDATGVRLADGPYETAAGFVLQALGHLPSVGEAVEVNGVRLTVRAMDGRRIERLRVSLAAEPASAANSNATDATSATEVTSTDAPAGANAAGAAHGAHAADGVAESGASQAAAGKR
jgi:putative hemolysin